MTKLTNHSHGYYILHVNIGSLRVWNKKKFNSYLNDESLVEVKALSTVVDDGQIKTFGLKRQILDNFICLLTFGYNFIETFHGPREA